MSFVSTIYNEHFGLKGKPFSLLPDPDFIFWSSMHTRAYSTLEYGLANFSPIVLITGEVGAGKTTLIHCLLRAAPHDYTIGLISNAHGKRGSLLHWCLAALNEPIPPGSAYVRLFSQFVSRLQAEAAEGRHVVLIFDEAQNLSPTMLEELRCFSNINGDKHELLQIILVGQPELRRKVGHRKLLQFAQRVAAEFHLSSMSRESVHAYIAHRLKVAGATQEIFTPAACDVMFEASAGLPRIVNQLCDHALVYAYAEDAETVGEELARQVAANRQLRWHCEQMPTRAAQPVEAQLS
jgi:general secretion pathway protein A